MSWAVPCSTLKNRRIADLASAGDRPVAAACFLAAVRRRIVNSKKKNLVALKCARLLSLQPMLSRPSLPLTFFAIFLGCASAEPVIPGLANERDPLVSGAVLVSELSCTACHSGGVPSKGGPDLSRVGSRIHRDYLERFIAAPHEVKPGTTMPDVFGDLSEEARKDAAEAIADYLQSIDESAFTLDSIAGLAVERGKELYHQVGCVACHSPEDKEIEGSASLNGIAEKYSLNSLTGFLEDPLAVRPSGRMPEMQLTHWEAVDIASYLLRDQKMKAPVQKLDRAVEGAQLFERYGCVQCHEPAKAKGDFAKNMAALDVSKVCSSVDYSLSEKQRESIQTAMTARPEKKVDPIRLTLTQMNCVSCHQRDDFGGVSPERDSYFTTSNLNLGDQARIPPVLTGVGAKLKPGWLRKVLVSGASVRPYMHTRMPKFGAGNVGHLVELFGDADSLPAVEIDRVKDAKLARESGHSLVGIKNLACVSCHTFNGQSATTLAGMDLADMTSRLQENWFHLYLLNPLRFNATTIMPSYWPGGKASRPEVLDGNSSQQIDAIWQYLSRGREARMPEGIRREPIEYGPSNGEAVMLRRQYNGIGKRGIGVGYPSGINMAFDAQQMRLGTIWKGDFGEMSGVWLGQGSGNVNERSRDVVRFPVGPAIAFLKSPDAQWPVFEKGQMVPGAQFLGYTLDEKQRPTFRYSINGIEVTDGFIDTEGNLRRTITLSEPGPPDLYLRLRHSDTDLKNLAISPADERFSLAGKTTLTIDYKFQLK